MSCQNRNRAMPLDNLNLAANYQVYCDMDGVLVDLIKGFRSIQVTNKQHAKEVLFTYSVEDYVNFWAELDWMPGGQELWNFISSSSPIILSKPHRNNKYRPHCEIGKAEWIHRNLNPEPASMIFTMDKYKHAAKNRILIDDSKTFIKEWKDHGGIGIRHIHTRDTLDQLTELMTGEENEIN